MPTQHANILNAYLSRITRSDLEKLLKLDTARLHQQLNGNNSAQNEAAYAYYNGICKAIDNLSQYDKELIEGIVLKSIN